MAYYLTTGYTPGTSCPYVAYPVTHKVRARHMDIYIYSSDLHQEYSVGSYPTVMTSKPSITEYNGKDHILYSGYYPTRSNIHAIPITRTDVLNETPDVFDFDAYFASLNNGGSGHSIGGDTGVIIPEPPVINDPINITDPADRTLYANMDLDPYRKKLDSSPQIRYLYTGREYNVETADFYYRARMMDSSIGRFSGKDPVKYLNLYRYVENSPFTYRDTYGLYSSDDFLLDYSDNYFRRYNQTLNAFSALGFSLTLDGTSLIGIGLSFEGGLKKFFGGTSGSALLLIINPSLHLGVLVGSTLGALGDALSNIPEEESENPFETNQEPLYTPRGDYYETLYRGYRMNY